jgi:hypothetical protein
MLDKILHDNYNLMVYLIKRSPIMNRIILLLAFLLLIGVSAFGQDPGIQDSIIIGSASIDSGQTFAFIPIIAETDDSVIYYDISITWRVPQGGVAVTGPYYVWPLSGWDDHSDTLCHDPDYLRMYGWADIGGETNPPLFTDGQRDTVIMLRFIISPNSHPQIVIIDSMSACGFGTDSDGFIPAFVPGYIFIGNPQAVGHESESPDQFSLSQNYPNPFNSSTEIEFSMPQSGTVTLVIYDIQGREIRRLLDSDIEAGSHSVIWNGIDNSNEHVASGIYFCRLISDGASQTNRMTLLR